MHDLHLRAKSGRQSRAQTMTAQHRQSATGCPGQTHLTHAQAVDAEEAQENGEKQNVGVAEPVVAQARHLHGEGARAVALDSLAEFRQGYRGN